MRTDHFLRRLKSDTLPGRLVAVDCDGHYQDVPGVGARQREHLDGWSAVGWERPASGAERDWVGSGTDHETFWQAADWHLRRGGICWIVAYNACRVLGLLGLWERMQEGKLVLNGGVQSGDAEGRGRGGAGVRGVPNGEDDFVQAHANEPTGDDVPKLPPRIDVKQPGRTVGRQHGRGFACLEDPPTILQLTRPGRPGRVVIVDSRNYDLVPPADLTCAAGRSQWVCDAMRRLCAALRAHRLGSLCVTAGSQAMAALRRHYLLHAIHVHTDERALELEGRAYFGGRCESRYVGAVRGTVYHVDFRSMYGAICSRLAVPVLLRGVVVRPGAVDDSTPGWPSCCVADVTVRTPSPLYPMRRGKSPTYPIGYFRTTLAGPELSLAVARGHVQQVHAVASYACARALRGVSQALYGVIQSAKAAGDGALAAWAKRCLVCVPGRFARRGGTWKPYVDPPDHQPWTTWAHRELDGTVLRCRDLAGQSEWEEQLPWSDDAVPAIAAFVTSEARVKLVEAIEAAGWREVYYYDTDSLFCTSTGYDALRRAGLVDEQEWGALRTQGVYKSVAFLGPKHYCCDGRVVCAGLPKGHAAAGPEPGSYWYTEQLARQARSGEAPKVARVLRSFRVGGGPTWLNYGSDGWLINEVLEDERPCANLAGGGPDGGRQRDLFVRDDDD